MIEPMPWLERQFPSGLAPGLLPAIVERLHGTPARLAAFVAETDAGVRARRAGGKWSIQEHIGHLLDLEPLWARRLSELLEGVEELCGADVTNAATTAAGHNDVPVERILDRFASARRELVERLERVSAVEAGRTALHPRLRVPLCVVDHACFIAEHDDHHLAAMRRLRRLAGERA